jgi:hypothetical protein
MMGPVAPARSVVTGLAVMAALIAVQIVSEPRRHG